jgi:hypothetical protein
MQKENNRFASFILVRSLPSYPRGVRARRVLSTFQYKKYFDRGQNSIEMKGYTLLMLKQTETGQTPDW